MRQLVICMLKYFYNHFRKFYEGLFGMLTWKPVADTE